MKRLGLATLCAVVALALVVISIRVEVLIPWRRVISMPSNNRRGQLEPDLARIPSEPAKDTREPDRRPPQSIRDPWDPNPPIPALDLPPESVSLHVQNGKFADKVTFSPDGKLLVAGDALGAVHVWDWRAKKEVKLLGDHASHVYAIGFNESGTRFCSSELEGKILVYETPTFRRIDALEGHDRSLKSLAFSGDGQKLVSASYDSSVRLWDLATFRQISSFTGNSGMPRFDLAFFNPDGKIVAIEAGGGQYNRINLLDRDNLSLVRQKPCGETYLSSAVARGAKAFVTVDAGGLISVWDPATLDPIAEFRPGPRSIHLLALSPDASVLAFGFTGLSAETEKDGTAVLFELRTGRMLRYRVGKMWTFGLDFAPNGRSLAVSTGSGDIAVLPVEFGR
jgi:WD40 repeat protein